jgi:transcriptional regulator with XRE-family HTH domain
MTEGLIDREPGSRQPCPELSLAVIEGLKRKGLSQSEIARQFGVTRQAISYYVRKYGGELTPRQKALEHWPWMVPVRLSNQVPYKRLRDHGEYYATNGKGMSPEKLGLLRSFYQRLEGLVVEFDPDLPPSEGAGIGGFAYRERLESDGDLLIRVNEHTFLSEEGLKIWVRPKVLPDPLMNRKA